MMTTKKTKTTTKPSASKLNAFTPMDDINFVTPEETIEVWRVYVVDTREQYFAYDKLKALEYIGKKGATNFSLHLTKVNRNLIY